MTDNPLVAPRSRFDWEEYKPDLRKGVPGNPYGPWLTNEDRPYAGVALWTDADAIVKEIESGDDFELVLEWVTGTLDALGLVIDPFGALISAGVGWLLEHVKPLKLMLDLTAGEPTIIQAKSDTWGNVSVALKDAAAEYDMSVGPQTAEWSGKAADAYRNWSKKAAALVDTTGKCAEGMAALIKMAGIAAATLRTFLRNIIATLVGKLVDWALELLATRGAASPVVMEQALVEIARTIARAVRAIKALFKVIKQIMTALDRVNTVSKGLLKMAAEMSTAEKIHAR